MALSNFRSNGASNSNGNIARSLGRSSATGCWLQCWVGLLCSITVFSLLVAYFFYVQPCDYFVGNYTASPCHMRTAPMIVEHQIVPNNGTASTSPRLYSDEEITFHAAARDILMHHSNDRPAGAKIAFMFLTPGPLPLESVWEDFFTGHEGLYSIYVHASEGNSNLGWKSTVFKGRAIPSRKVFWGRIEMVDAERRLMSYALLDPSNMFFVLLSDSCIPLFHFNYVYAYLMGADKSFVEAFDDPGFHGRGRYLQHMLPEVRIEDWRKGPQWMALHRAHAMLVVLDHVYYKKFKTFCKPGMVDNMRFNCVADEHYIPTFLQIMDPNGIANRSLTYADWTEGKWHPRAFGKKDVTPLLVMEMQSMTSYVHVTSEELRQVTSQLCLWNGDPHPCYLFARKFLPETAVVLRQRLPNLLGTTYNRR